MKIAYISSTSSGMHSRSIYYDLLQEFKENGHDVTVIYAREAREKLDSEMYSQNGIRYLGVKTGNITKNKNLIEKVISILTIDRLFVKEISKCLEDEQFDLVLYSTPPITFNKTIDYFIDRGAFAYLMLKDIFPQNAVDIGLFKNKGLINYYFKRKEAKLYKKADMIGVMSPANRDFLIEQDASLRKKIEILPNSVKMYDQTIKYTRKDFDLDENDLMLLYGGNLGLPQGVPFILQCIDALEETTGIKLVICGSGSEEKLIIDKLADGSIKNTKFLGQLSREEYAGLTTLADVGLIYLDYRFIVPNYPQRLLDYLANYKPVICATDTNTDIGKIAVENGYGLSVESNNVTQWLEAVNTLKNDPDLRDQMSKRGYEYISTEYNVEKIIHIITAHF